MRDDFIGARRSIAGAWRNLMSVDLHTAWLWIFPFMMTNPSSERMEDPCNTTVTTSHGIIGTLAFSLYKQLKNGKYQKAPVLNKLRSDLEVSCCHWYASKLGI